MCSLISYELVRAYGATRYEVADDPWEMTLLVDQQCAGLRGLYDLYGVTSAAFLTAFNPYSELTSPERNFAAQDELQRNLLARGFTFFHGKGVDPSRRWPGEPSVLVLGVDMLFCRQLAEQNGQNAFVWCDESAVPRLILMR